MPRATAAHAASLAADRAIVERLVRRAGMNRLRFDVFDVRAELTPELKSLMEAPTALAQRLAELEGTMVRRVEGALGMVLVMPALAAPTPPTATRKSRGGTNGPRITKQYVLSSRQHELKLVSPAMLDDLERMVLALAIAILKLGGRPAPTRLVTDVLKTVPELTISTTQQTNVLLGRLSARKMPVVQEEKDSTQRTSRWLLIEPLRPRWLEWVSVTLARYERALAAVPGAVGAEGATSQAELAARIVRGAVKESCSSHWPEGHPLTANEIGNIVSAARIGQRDPQDLGPLEDALRRQGTDIPTALRAAARVEFSDGTHRRAPLVHRVDHPRLRSPRYVSGEFDVEAARSWAELAAFRIETKREARDHMEDEWRAARKLLTANDGAVQAIGLVRCVALRRAVDARIANGIALGPRLAQISGHHQPELERLIGELTRITKSWPDASALEAGARGALRPLGVSLTSVLDAPRPVITAGELADMLPSSLTEGVTTAVLAATATTIRRVDVAPEERTTRVGTGRAESRRLDRVDAVHYAAETAMLPGMPAIQRGVELIGATHADPLLVRRVLKSASPEHRIAAMGAAVLLGDLQFLGRLLIRRARELCEIASVLEVTSVVELSWWLSSTVRHEITALALRDSRQSVKAAAMRARQSSR